VAILHYSESAFYRIHMQKADDQEPPNMPLKLTPLCGLKIGAFLEAGIKRARSRSFRAAQLSARALGGLSYTTE
jgi:hypothetical protein